jgi:hypothetical protein
MEDSTDGYSEYFVDTLICKDCKFNSSSFTLFTSEYLRCNRTTGKIDFVTGKPETLTDYCSIERLHDSYLNKKRCGPSGRFYEASQWKKIKLFFNKGE